MSDSKRCTKCHVVKALDEFHLGKGPMGRQSWCKSCKTAGLKPYAPRPKVQKRCVSCDAVFTAKRADAVRCDACPTYKQPLVDIQCKACGDWFRANNKSRKYCDKDDCQTVATGRVPRRWRLCDECGVAFVPRRSESRFCDDHRNRTSRAKDLVERPCRYCGTPFTPDHDARRLCSDACRRRHQLERERAARILRKWNLTAEQVASLAELGCGICGTTEWGGKHGIYHFDHDHDCPLCESGCPLCFRGLLCDAHNKGIGMFRDNPEHLAAAIDYLTGGNRELWVIPRAQQSHNLIIGNLVAGGDVA